MSKLYGYMRVSTEQQNEERQKVELLNAGVPKENIFLDKKSGKDFNRPQYQELLSKLEKGDCLILKSLDRLGRNYKEIGEQWKYITDEIQADIKILDMPLLDTSVQKDLIGTLISDMVLMLLSYVSEQERDLIKQRQKEGIAIAKANGVSFGRKKSPYPPDFDKVHLLYLNKSITGKKAAEDLGITYNSFIWFHRKKKDELDLKQ